MAPDAVVRGLEWCVRSGGASIQEVYEVAHRCSVLDGTGEARRYRAIEIDQAHLYCDLPREYLGIELPMSPINSIPAFQPSAIFLSWPTRTMSTLQMLKKVGKALSQMLHQAAIYSLMTMWLLLFDYSPPWSGLRRISRLSWVKSSYVWFLIVPAAAYLLKDIGPSIAFSLGTSVYEIPVGLPFSWKLFYFGAVCFAIGALIYNWGCPPLIRDYDGFNQYADEGRGMEYITNELLALKVSRWDLEGPTILAKASERAIRQIAEYLFLFTDAPKVDWPNAKSLEPLIGKLVSPYRSWYDPNSQAGDPVRYRDGVEPDAFWFVRWRSECTKEIARWMAYRLYAIGLILHLVVASQGFYYVWQVTARSFI